MKYLLSISILFFALSQPTFSQKFNKNIDKDSLFNEVLKNIPEENRDELKETYREENEQSKEYLLFMLSMPRSSKKELVENYEKNSQAIARLKTEYGKLVPDSLIVFIEFNPANRIISEPESIDLKIYRKNPGERSEVVSQEWNLDKKSDKLANMLVMLGWNLKTLADIEQLLDRANCMSIENGKITTIGFARSGMGKYFYKIFDQPLSTSQIEDYNDGCTYIYYKDNIVLEYGGGAIGPECFPDE